LLFYLFYIQPFVSVAVKYGVPRVVYILSLFKVQPFAGIIDTVKYGVPRVVYILSLFKVQPFAGIIDTVKYGVPRVVYILSLFKVQPFAGIIDTVKYGVPRVLFNWNAVGPFRSGKRNQDVVATGIVL
jgi:hypothetical protein